MPRSRRFSFSHLRSPLYLLGHTSATTRAPFVSLLLTSGITAAIIFEDVMRADDDCAYA